MHLIPRFVTIFRQTLSLVVVWATVALLVATASGAESRDTAENSDGDAPPTVEVVQGWIEALTPEELESERGQQLKAAWTQYVDSVEKAKEADARRAELEGLKAGREEIRLRLLDEIEKLMQPVEQDLPTTLTLAQAELQLNQLEARLSQARADKTAAEQALARTMARPGELSPLITAAKARRSEVSSARSTATPAAEIPEEARARQLAREALLAQLDAQIEAWELEMGMASMLSQRARAQLDIAGLSEKRAEAELKVLRARTVQLGSEAAERTVEEARTRAGNSIPAVAQQALANAELAARRSGGEGIVVRIARFSADRDRARQELDTLVARFASVRQKVEAVGDARTLAPILAHELDRLPNLRELRREVHDWETAIPTLQLETIDLQDARNDLFRNFDAAVAEAARPAAALPPDERSAVNAEIRELLQARLQLLEEIVLDHERLMGVYTDFARIEKERIGVIQDFTAYINRHIQWVRGDGIWTAAFWRHFSDASIWLVSWESWGSIVDAVQEGGLPKRLMFVMEFAFFCALWLMRGMLCRWIVVTAKTRAGNRMNILPLLSMLGLTLLLALPFPALIWLVGNRLVQLSANSRFAFALGHGFLDTLPAFTFLAWLRALMVRSGYAETFMNWPAESSSLLRKRLGKLIAWLTIISVPMHTVVAWEHTDWTNAWGSVGLGLFFVALSWLMYATLNPRGRFLSAWSNASDATPSMAIRALRIVATLMPLVIVFFICAGFTRAAFPMAKSLFRTIEVVLLLWVVETALFHAVFVHVSRLAAFRKLMRRERGGSGEGEGESEQGEIAPMDLGAIARHSRLFIRWAIMGIGLVLLAGQWYSTVPAFETLGSVELWSTGTPLPVPPDAPEGLPVAYDMVTVSEALMALLVLVLSIVLAKNLPGAIELTVLRLYKLDAGMRYALRTICSYILLLAGPMIAFSQIGIGWSKLQWLAAALSVGLGFGLQEIFANFISGIIILFERPLRIGDIVTVGDTSGTVTRIQMRATVITDWDRREILIPNKEIITGRVTNWTLSDSTSRIQVDVGVSYGTDTAAALEIMKAVARDTERILSTPPPNAVFVGFGDSCLNLRLYAFIESRDYYWASMTRIHQEIDRRFQEAGITFPFPQRDVNLRIIPGDPDPTAPLTGQT